MADLLNFEPLFPDQDEETILERWRGWANEGLDPAEDVEQWTDTREGSHWWVMTTPGRREAARQYDAMGTEVVAAAFPQWSWGRFLDDHGELRNLERNVATYAGGTVTFVGEEGTVIPPGTVVGVEPADPDADAPEYETTVGGEIPAPIDPATAGVLDLPVRAREAGSASNVGIAAISAVITPLEGIEAVGNDDPIVGGTDAETDEAYRPRILESFVGVAVANALYYRRLALNYPGIGRVAVVPAADGPGTITLIISTASGDPVAPEVVAGFQALVDPDPGQGAGQGQVGATITVVTATTLEVAVAATVETEPGYSLDGLGGTIPLRDAIEAAVAAYIDSVEAGGEVVLAQVLARIASIQGVHDVTGVTLNGVAGNVDVAADPPEAPTLALPMDLVAA